MESFLSTVFIGFGVVFGIAAVVMIIGFVLSMPAAVVYAIKEHHEHPVPHTPHEPHYRQMRINLHEHHMPKKQDFRQAWQDLTHPAR